MDQKTDSRQINDPGKNRPFLSRRELLAAGAVGATAVISGTKSQTKGTPAVHTNRKPNILFIITDQQGLNTISSLGCRNVRTPAMDDLAENGVSFTESYCTNPLCSPSRSSLFTSRMPSETGVIYNGIGVIPSIPNMGQWFTQQGYECVYAGKWHLWHPHPWKIPGFKVLPTGINNQGMIGDSAISRVCQGYLRNRSGSNPFLLVASFVQPHDICGWVSMHSNSTDKSSCMAIADEALPELPSNFHFDAHAPNQIRKFQGRLSWTKQQWRYYLWSYYRQVEMVDAEIGRLLQALNDLDQVNNTLIVFTSDHGEGMAHHKTVLKNFLYDEAAKVPLVVSWPGHLQENVVNRSHLVSGLDIMPTLCDYAGIGVPPKIQGRTLRPLLENKICSWREFLIAEVQKVGRMVRTSEFKYITYQGDPIEQLFDMKSDPGETKNLIDDSRYASTLADHQKMLQQWENGLERAPLTN